MIKSIKTLVFLLCLATFVQMVPFNVTRVESLPHWSPIGPSGGDRYEVVIDPTDHLKLYVLGGAVHKSTDGGEHWQAIMETSVETRGLYAYSLAINPQNPNEIYLGTTNEGVWKSSNGGALWDPANNSLPDTDQQVRSLVVDGTNPQVVYVSIWNESGTAQEAVYRSVNGGSTWTSFDVGLPLTKGAVLFQNPLNKKLFAGTYGQGIYKYDSSGGTWIPVNEGLNPGVGRYIVDMAFDPLDEMVIYAATKKDWIFKSTDGGESWQHIEYPLPLSPGALYPPMAYFVRVDPNNSNRIWIGAWPGLNYPNECPFYQTDPNQDVGGLFLSTDKGLTWEKVMPNYGGFRLTIDPVQTIGAGSNIRSKVLYLTFGNVNGVLKSEDGGETFTRKIEGINGAWINTLLQHPVDSAKLFGSNEGQLFFTFNSGATWSFFNPSSNGQMIYVWSIAADPTDPSRLYYATGEPAWAWPGNKGLYTINLSDLDPSQEINSVSGEQITSTAGKGIWKVYPFGSSVIYLATQDQGVLKSENAGQSWQPLKNGLGQMSVSCIAFDQSGSPLYAGTRESNGNPNWVPSPTETGAIYKWLTATQQWSRIGSSAITTAVFDIVTLPGDPNTIYVGTTQGFFVSEDGGTTWDPKNTGLPASPLISDIEIDPNNPQRIFLSSWYNGVYISTSGGDYWDPFNEGLTHFSVQDIMIDSQQPDVIYAATLGGSVFRSITGNEPLVDSVIGNGAPLVKPYTLSVKEREGVQVTINAHDPDPGDELTYTAYCEGVIVPAPGENPSLPFTFNPITRTFLWVPTYGWGREEPYTILFVISDGVASARVEVKIIVERTLPPVVDSVIANGQPLSTPYTITITEMEELTIQIAGHDPEGFPITYSDYYGDPELSTSTFDPDTASFHWQPVYGFASGDPYRVTFALSDGYLSTTATVDIIVEPAEPVYAPEMNLTLSKSVYYRNEMMDVMASVRNFYSPCTVDIYLAFGPQSDPYSIYIPRLMEVELTYGYDIQGINLMHLQLPGYPSDTYVWTGIIIPAGGNVTNQSIWLSSDAVSFTFINGPSEFHSLFGRDVKKLMRRNRIRNSSILPGKDLLSIPQHLEDF